MIIELMSSGINFRISLFSLPQECASNLSVGGLGKLFDELDLARILVRVGVHAMILELFRQVGRLDAAPALELGLIFGRQHDEGLYHLAELGIRTRHDGRFKDGRMLDQRGFNLERTDSIAGEETI